MRTAAALVFLLLALSVSGATFESGSVLSVSELIVPCAIDPPPAPSSTTILHDRRGGQRDVSAQAVSALAPVTRGVITSRWVAFDTQSIELLEADGRFTPLPTPIDLPQHLTVTDVVPNGDGLVAMLFNFAGPGRQEFWRFDVDGHLTSVVEAPSLDYYINSIDLAADRCTLFFASGQTIGRFNVCTGSRLADFADQGASALRVLPDGGLLAAFNSAILRYDTRGSVTARFPIPGMSANESVGALALDVDPTVAWAITTFGCSPGAARVFAINTTTGALISGPSAITNGAGHAIAVANGWFAEAHPTAPLPRRRTVR